MADRRSLVTRGALTGALILGLGLLPVATGGRSVQHAEQPVAAAEGSGILAKTVCVSCAAAIIGISGGSVGGFVLLGALYPELYGACAYQCYYAFS